MVEGKSVDLFRFNKFLYNVLLHRNKKIIPHEISFINKYGNKLRDLYARLLDEIDHEISKGDLIQSENYIKKQVNGKFTEVIDSFIKNYDIYKNNPDRN